MASTRRRACVLYSCARRAMPPSSVSGSRSASAEAHQVQGRVDGISTINGHLQRTTAPTAPCPFGCEPSSVWVRTLLVARSPGTRNVRRHPDGFAWICCPDRKKIETLFCRYAVRGPSPPAEFIHGHRMPSALRATRPTSHHAWILPNPRSTDEHRSSTGAQRRAENERQDMEVKTRHGLATTQESLGRKQKA